MLMLRSGPKLVNKENQGVSHSVYGRVKTPDGLRGEVSGT